MNEIIGRGKEKVALNPAIVSNLQNQSISAVLICVNLRKSVSHIKMPRSAGLTFSPGIYFKRIQQRPFQELCINLPGVLPVSTGH